MTKEKSKLLAFSLIEILVVLAIIGIVSAVGIPAYAEYTKKTKVRTAYQDGKAAQAKIAGVFAKTGSLTKANSKSYKNSEAQTYDFLIPSSDYTSSIEVRNGIVVMELDGSSIGTGDSSYIMLELSSDGSWACSATSNVYSYLSGCEESPAPEEEEDGEGSESDPDQ